MSKTVSKDPRAEIAHRQLQLEREDERISSFTEQYIDLHIPVKELLAVIMRMPSGHVFNFMKAIDHSMEDGEFSCSMYQYFHDVVEGVIATDVNPTLDNCTAKFKEMEEQFKNDPEVIQKFEQIQNMICELAVDIRSNKIVNQLAEELQETVTVNK